MRLLRNLIHARPILALLMVAMALCMKALVPSGYMVSAGSKTFTVGLCTDGMGLAQTTTITVPMDRAAPAEPSHKGKTDGVCAFSALSMAAMGGADAALLAVALLFILMSGAAFVPQFVAQRGLRWHPPMRAPPLHG
ncbi:MAG: hypothetical protein HC788_04500 [Sphingopyxis sp.]|nr:hypothetical protein [Sphingopyxis sp.]